MGPVDLPGPTGESNQYLLEPRGKVLCLGPTPNGLLVQVTKALSMGNAVVAIAADATATLRPLLKNCPVSAAAGWERCICRSDQKRFWKLPLPKPPK